MVRPAASRTGSGASSERVPISLAVSAQNPAAGLRVAPDGADTSPAKNGAHYEEDAMVQTKEKLSTDVDHADTSSPAAIGIAAQRTRFTDRCPSRAESEPAQAERTFRPALLRDVRADVRRIRRR